MKFLVTLLLLTISLSAVASPKDSLQYEALIRRVTQLETDNKILVEKINTLNSANDKILTAAYFFIGSVVALLALVTFWNGFQNWLTNTKRIDEIRHTSQLLIDKSIADLGDALARNFVRSHEVVSLKEFQQTFDAVKKIRYNLLQLYIRFNQSLLINIKFIDATPDANFEHSRLVEILSYAIEIRSFNIFTGNSEITDAVKAIKEYLDKSVYGLTDFERLPLVEAVNKIPQELSLDYGIPDLKQRLNNIKRL